MPATSEKQRKFFGLIRGIQKGKSKGSARAKAVAKQINPQDASEFAAKVVKRRLNKKGGEGK